MREIAPSASCHTDSATSAVNIGNSLRNTCDCTAIGLISAVTPRISATLVMLEPYALPSASPGLPCNAASADTAISGADVPKPTITMPTSSGGMPKCRAVAAAPSTKRSALHTSSTRPDTKAAKGKYMGKTKIARVSIARLHKLPAITVHTR